MKARRVLTAALLALATFAASAQGPAPLPTNAPAAPAPVRAPARVPARARERAQAQGSVPEQVPARERALVPDLAPVVVGENFAVNVTLFPAASVAASGKPLTENCGAADRRSPLKVSVLFPVFLTVMATEPVAFTATLPKLT